MRQLGRPQRQLDGPHRQLGGTTKNMLLKTALIILHSTVNRPLVMAHEYEYEFKCSAKITTPFHKLRLKPNSSVLADLLWLYTSSNSFSHPVGKSSKEPLR